LKKGTNHKDSVEGEKHWGPRSQQFLGEEGKQKLMTPFKEEERRGVILKNALKTQKRPLKTRTFPITRSILSVVATVGGGGDSQEKKEGGTDKQENENLSRTIESIGRERLGTIVKG